MNDDEVKDFACGVVDSALGFLLLLPMIYFLISGNIFIPCQLLNQVQQWLTKILDL